MKKLRSCLLLTAIAFSSAAQSLDYQMIHEINVENRTVTRDNSFKCISHTSQYITAAAPFAILATGIFSKNKNLIRQGENAAISFAISSVSTYVLKNTIRRDRPFVTYKDIVKMSNGGGKSFPSGHTSAAFCIATSIALDNKQWYIRAPVLAWASLVGYSRVYLGVHYPTDVLAGAIVGAGSAFAGRKINNWLHREKKTARKHPPTP